MKFVEFDFCGTWAWLSGTDSEFKWVVMDGSSREMCEEMRE